MSEANNPTSPAPPSKKELKKAQFFQRLKKKKKPHVKENGTETQPAVGLKKRKGPRKTGRTAVKGVSGRPASRKHRDTDKQIYIGGLPYKMSEDDVREMFSSCGAIKSINLPMNRQGKPAGFGFVIFESADSISQALALDGHELQGRFIQVRFGAYEQSDKTTRDIVAAALKKKKEQQASSTKKGKKKKASAQPADSAETTAPATSAKRPLPTDSAEDLFGNVSFDFDAPSAGQSDTPKAKKPKVVKF